MEKLDIAIIGAGTAGLSARSVVEKYTQNYKVFDAGILGTTCARVGCMPSKVLIQSANDYHRRLSLVQEGIQGAETLTVHVNETFAHVRALRDRFVQDVMQGMHSWKKTHLVNEYVEIKNQNILQTSNGQEFETKKIIISTGSTPIVPKAFKGFESYCVTTDELFEMESVPSTWAVIGMGVIGLELGQAMDRLGLHVTMFGRRLALAGISDPEILAYAHKNLKKELNMICESIINVAEKKGQLEIKTKSQVVLVDRVLLAAGRAPNVARLKLNQAGISVNEQGVPVFDSETMLVKDSNHIFIAGDCNDEKEILHEAADEGRIAGYNACQENVTSFQRRTPLGIIFTDPNIAFVGKKYQELVDEKISFETGKVSFEGQGRAIVKLKEKGILHVYADSTSGIILGAEMFAPEGEHLAQMLSWAISENWTVDQTLSKPFYHPVIQEGLRTALRNIKQNQYEIEIPTKT